MLCSPSGNGTFTEEQYPSCCGTAFPQKRRRRRKLNLLQRLCYRDRPRGRSHHPVEIGHIPWIRTIERQRRRHGDLGRRHPRAIACVWQIDYRRRTKSTRHACACAGSAQRLRGDDATGDGTPARAATRRPTDEFRSPRWHVARSSGFGKRSTSAATRAASIA